MVRKIKIRDIARTAEVSPASVSQAFNDPHRVNRETRKRILEVAEKLGYVRIRQKKAKKGVIGVIADNYYNLLMGEFYNMVVLGILDELKSRKMNVLLEAVAAGEEYFPKMITKNLVDGLLFLGKVSRDLIMMIKQKDIPIVLVGHPIPDMEIHTIVSDGRSGAIQAVTHLIELGHKNIAIVTGEPAFDPITSERLEGYKFALSNAGIRTRAEYIAQADFGKPETATEAVVNLLGLKDPPTAIFCASDSLAFRAYKAIDEAGLKIPKDISVVGFDNISAPPYAEEVSPSLTSINVDRYQMGKMSVDLLFDIIANPSKTACRHTLPVKLVIKNSTKSPKKGR